MPIPLLLRVNAWLGKSEEGVHRDTQDEKKEEEKTAKHRPDSAIVGLVHGSSRRDNLWGGRNTSAELGEVPHILCRQAPWHQDKLISPIGANTFRLWRPCQINGALLRF